MAIDPMLWQPIVSIGAIAGYFYCYSALIERLKKNHPLIWVSLGKPTEMDSNLSPSFARMSGFLLHLEFLKVPDPKVKFLGSVVFVTNIAAIGYFIFSFASGTQ